MASRAVLVKLLADATGAKAGIRETAAEVRKFGAYTAEATVKIQTEGVQAKLDKLNAQLKRYGEQPHTADVQIRMGNVARQIERTELQLKGLTDRPHEVKVGVNERSFLRVRERIGKLSFGDTIGRAGGAAFAAAGLGAGVFEAVKSVTEAYNTEQGAQARVRTQLTALNIDYETHAKRIDEVIQRTSALSGLTGHGLSDAFTNIVRATGNVSQSLKLVGLSADIARAKNLDVAKAGQLVAKVAAGSTSALGRYGIVIKKGATATEALGILQHKFGGQAAAYGKTQQGALDRVNVAFEHLREVIGAKLAPTLTRAANGLARFVRQMADGTGAGGRFVTTLKGIATELKDIVGFLVRHRKAIAVAAAAWGIYRARARIATRNSRRDLERIFLNLGSTAATGGAIAGRGFAGRFKAIASRGLMEFGWAGIGAAIGAVIVSGITDKIAEHFNLTGNVGTPQSLVGPELHKLFGGLIGGGGSDSAASSGGYNKYTSGKLSVEGAGIQPLGSGVFRGFNRTGDKTPGGRDPRGVFSGGQLSVQERRNQRLARQKEARKNRPSLQDILAGLGSASQITTANLNLDLKQAEQAYATAVRKHGGKSPAAIQAAQNVIDARQAIADSQKAAATKSKTGGAAGQGAIPSTAGDVAVFAATRAYAQAVRAHGANSSEAKVAAGRETVARDRVSLTSALAKVGVAFRKFGANSEQYVKAETFASRVRVNLVKATQSLEATIKKNTAQRTALLPRLTDVAYHPVSGRLQHAPRERGVGAGGVVNHWGGIHNNITAPAGAAPDAEYLAAQLSRKLAAKGNA